MDMPKEDFHALYNRYLAHAHRMQSAVQMQISTLGDHAAGACPKHLRTGVNSAFVETSVLVKLLIEKGLFTTEEWMTMLHDGMKAEADRACADTIKACHLPPDTTFV